VNASTLRRAEACATQRFAVAASGIMFDRIVKLLSDPAPPIDRDGLQIAVAVLMVEAARMDDHFDDVERKVIERLLAQKFQLSPDQTRELVRKAVETGDRSNQLYPFTRLAVERMDPAQRVGLIEMLWEVAYADGVLDPEEDALLRRIAGLIYVSDVDRAAARIRVAERLARQQQ
jgi:uncharacterized tellurite resistance protein B-like protein